MKQGFTLIELLVVVLIIGILAAVAVPQYQRAVEKSRAMQAISIVKSIADAQEIYFLANGEYATSLAELDIDVPGEDCFYRSLPRKCLRDFDFGPQAAYPFSSSIAISNKWDNPNIQSANYFLIRFPQDTNIYCLEGGAGDTYKICQLLSGGQKGNTTDTQSYYVVSL